MSMNIYDRSIDLLCKGFAREFAEFCQNDERMEELMMDLAAEFVNENIPVVSEDAQIDVASGLLSGVAIKKI